LGQIGRATVYGLVVVFLSNPQVTRYRDFGRVAKPPRDCLQRMRFEQVGFATGSHRMERLRPWLKVGSSHYLVEHRSIVRVLESFGRLSFGAMLCDNIDSPVGSSFKGLAEWQFKFGKKRDYAMSAPNMVRRLRARNGNLCSSPMNRPSRNAALTAAQLSSVPVIFPSCMLCHFPVAS